MRPASIVASLYLLLAVVVTALSLLGVVLGPAPFSLPVLGSAGDPVVVKIAYSSEKKEWMEAAVKSFVATKPTLGRRPIQIELTTTGSGEIVAQLMSGKLKPTVVSPASSIPIEQLRSAWKSTYGKEIFATDKPRPLVLTPLVIVMWADRAKVLWPNQQADFWQRIHDAVSNPAGWQALDSTKTEWGQVKFGHTSPESSNSGMQTLSLLAYAFYNKSAGLTVGDIQNPEFQRWLGEIEQSIPKFNASTSDLMNDVVLQGPGAYSMVAVYENLALESVKNAGSRWGEIKIYYPPVNFVSDHPYAILDADWVTSDQRAAARRFGDYLLGNEMQQLALSFGFRPTQGASVKDANPKNPFTQYSSYGVQLDITQLAAVPSAEVSDALIQLWVQKYKR